MNDNDTGPGINLSIVVPVYRNAATLAPLFRRLSMAVAKEGLSFEIIFVNDASPDKSLEILKKLVAIHAEITILDLSENVGQHAAVLHGLSIAKGQYALIMDADLQDPPEAFSLLWQARSSDIDAIFAGRRGNYESRGRLLTSFLFKRILHWLCGVPVDAGMFILIKKSLVNTLLIFPTRIPSVVAMIGCTTLTTRSIPVKRNSRTGGKSSYGPWGRVYSAMRAILCVLEYKFCRSRTPYLMKHGKQVKITHQDAFRKIISNGNRETNSLSVECHKTGRFSANEGRFENDPNRTGQLPEKHGQPFEEGQERRRGNTKSINRPHGVIQRIYKTARLTSRKKASIKQRKWR